VNSSKPFIIFLKVKKKKKTFPIIRLCSYLNISLSPQWKKNLPQCFKSCWCFISDEGGLLLFTPPMMLFARPCDPAARRPCHLVLCVPLPSSPPRRGHLASHMEGTSPEAPRLDTHLPLNTPFLSACLPPWMGPHCPSSKRDRDKIFSVSIPVMFNQCPATNLWGLTAQWRFRASRGLRSDKDRLLEVAIGFISWSEELSEKDGFVSACPSYSFTHWPGPRGPPFRESYKVHINEATGGVVLSCCR